MPPRPSKSKKPAPAKAAKPAPAASLLAKSFNGPEPRKPLWEGPDGAGPNGGVTFSLLSRWLTCRERFRIATVEGLRAPEQFVAPIEVGNLWHAAEEAHALGKSLPVAAMATYATQLHQRFPFQREEITGWYEKCAALFPVYVGYWAKHPDVEARTPLLSEQVFDVPYRLPSGRTVRLRGKWDSVDLVTGGPNAGVWLQENKTKSQIDRPKINRQLTFDLQTMLYFVALKQAGERRDILVPYPGAQLKGVRYNVVRRSAHKSAESMLKKVHEDIADGRGAEWFARWNVEVSPADVDRFRRTCLDPMLENVADDYEWWDYCYHHPDRTLVYDGEHRREAFPHHVPRHYVHPFGVRNIIDEGGSSDLDECVMTGSTVGLRRAETLFPELQP